MKRLAAPWDRDPPLERLQKPAAGVGIRSAARRPLRLAAAGCHRRQAAGLRVNCRRLSPACLHTLWHACLPQGAGKGKRVMGVEGGAAAGAVEALPPNAAPSGRIPVARSEVRLPLEVSTHLECKWRDDKFYPARIIERRKVRRRGGGPSLPPCPCGPAWHINEQQLARSSDRPCRSCTFFNAGARWR